jgi:hypothetical protein
MITIWALSVKPGKNNNSNGFYSSDERIEVSQHNRQTPPTNQPASIIISECLLSACVFYGGSRARYFLSFVYGTRFTNQKKH